MAILSFFALGFLKDFFAVLLFFKGDFAEVTAEFVATVLDLTCGNFFDKFVLVFEGRDVLDEDLVVAEVLFVMGLNAWSLVTAALRFDGLFNLDLEVLLLAALSLLTTPSTEALTVFFFVKELFLDVLLDSTELIVCFDWAGSESGTM